MDVGIESGPLVNWTSFSQARAELGANFVRILGYFREDGVKSVDQIEAAMRGHNSAALVIPAHTLKGEARQFGADPLGDLAEEIEVIARACVERQVITARMATMIQGMVQTTTSIAVEWAHLGW